MLDFRVVLELGGRPIAVPTAMTVQNSRRCLGYIPTPPDIFSKMLQALLDDFAPAAVKVGMMPTRELARRAVAALGERGIPVVYDPVLAASDGCPLVSEGSELSVLGALAPLCDLLTPNADEASLLAGVPKSSNAFDEACAKRFFQMGIKAVLIKGGHRGGERVVDRLFVCDGRVLSHERMRRRDVRGTGCALSTAIATLLARGFSIRDAFREAERFMDAFIETGGALRW